MYYLVMRFISILLIFSIMSFVFPTSAEARRRVKKKKPKPAATVIHKKSEKSEITEKSDVGSLTIKSATEGATVIIDGQEVGTIPFPGNLRLKTGKHTLKILRRGYTEYLDVFKIEKDKPTVLEIDLIPVAGILIVTSAQKDGRVYVDGKYIGTTPLDKEVLIGKRSVRVTLPGYHDGIKTVKCLAGQETAIHFQLEALPEGSSPYRPAPEAPPQWYEKWYVWVGAAGGALAITAAILIPVLLSSDNKIDDFHPDYQWQASSN